MCPTLCDLIDCSPPGNPSVHGISQARILEWIAIRWVKKPEGTFWSTKYLVSTLNRYYGSLLGAVRYIVWFNNQNNKSTYKLAICVQSCLTLCNPIDCSPPGSSLHGIVQQEYWSVLSCIPPGYLPDPGTEPTSPAPSASQADSLLLRHQGSPGYMSMWLTLCNPMDCSTPGSSVHGDSPGMNARVGCYAIL